MTTPRRLTPEESANAWAEGERRSNELRQQTAKMRLPPFGLENEVALLRAQYERTGRTLDARNLEIAELKLRLAASEAVSLAALEKAKKLEAEVGGLTTEVGVLKVALEIAKERGDRLQAEVDQWRRAIRWRNVGNGKYVLLIRVGESHTELASIFQYAAGWTVDVRGTSRYGILPSRDKACAAVCEMLAIPEILLTTPATTPEM